MMILNVSAVDDIAFLPMNLFQIDMERINIPLNGLWLITTRYRLI